MLVARESFKNKVKKITKVEKNEKQKLNKKINCAEINIKMYYKVESISRDKKEIFMVIKGSIHQKDITILNT